MKKILVVLVILIFGNAATAQSRSGFYELNAAQGVNIEDKSKSIVFNLEAADGNDIYKLRSTANLIRRNVFQYRKITRGRTENYDCRILFTFSHGLLTIEENDDCGYDRFPNVTLSGKYRLD